MGPATPFHLVEDLDAIRTLAELGVILLMYSIGLEFSLRRLAKLLPVVGPAATVEIGLMLVLGFLAGTVLGWTVRDSLFLGGVVAISSTMIVAKSFSERRPRLIDACGSAGTRLWCMAMQSWPISVFRRMGSRLRRSIFSMSEVAAG